MMLEIQFQGTSLNSQSVIVVSIGFIFLVAHQFEL